MSERRFPVLDAGLSLPWEYVEIFEAQALKNHSQSLETLASRGGLSAQELWCVAHGRSLREYVPPLDAADAWVRKQAALLDKRRLALLAAKELIDYIVDYGSLDLHGFTEEECEADPDSCRCDVVKKVNGTYSLLVDALREE